MKSETMSWITAEINASEDALKTATRYDKKKLQGYVLALKRCQAKLDIELFKDGLKR